MIKLRYTDMLRCFIFMFANLLICLMYITLFFYFRLSFFYILSVFSLSSSGKDLLLTF